jgi:3-deoxy-manno-octulosonate cytidylyltransferase (CMP-KDO synthetase)
MKNTAIIIPTRLNAKRFPNKPLAKIKNLPMILHVLDRAKESQAGEVYVATPDKEIVNVVREYGGKAFLTKTKHESGSDRIYEVYLEILNNKVDLIINLQGDMPNIKPNDILKLEKLMRNNKCEIGTLASPIKNKDEISDRNIVKIEVNKNLNNDSFVDVVDFFRTKKDLNNNKIYHHVGIYAFTNVALSKYVKLSRSKLEIERNLEQMRAMENSMVIKTGFTESAPLGVDTEKDLLKVTREINLI